MCLKADMTSERYLFCAFTGHACTNYAMADRSKVEMKLTKRGSRSRHEQNYPS